MHKRVYACGHRQAARSIAPPARHPAKKKIIAAACYSPLSDPGAKARAGPVSAAPRAGKAALPRQRARIAPAVAAPNDREERPHRAPCNARNWERPPLFLTHFLAPAPGPRGHGSTAHQAVGGGRGAAAAAGAARTHLACCSGVRGTCAICAGRRGSSGGGGSVARASPRPAPAPQKGRQWSESSRAASRAAAARCARSFSWARRS